MLLTLVAPVRTLVAQAQSIWDVPGAGRPIRAVITIGEDRPETDPGDPPMLLRLRGVLGDLQGKDLRTLHATCPPAPHVGDAADAERVCTVHLLGANSRARIAVYRKNGAYVAVEMDRPEPRRAELRGAEFAQLLATLPLYRGTFTPPEGLARGKPFELERPYEPGWFTIDKKMLGARLLNGGMSAVDGTTRTLSDEHLWARIPAGYDPKAPAGLLVWINAGRAGEIPAPFAPALDELGIIAVGAADSGNERHIATRIQLAFDALATASRRFHIDPRRVYISGISGGGRMSSTIAACWPDVFAGCVPIVGLSCYRVVPSGTGMAWPAGFSRPGTDRFKFLRMRRFAPMTGRKDFNELEIQQAASIYQRDGVPLRLFDHETMGHQLPAPKDLREALLWVDEPYRRLRAAETEAGAKALDEYKTKVGQRPPSTPSERRLLLKAIESGPWTPAAWEAAAVLGIRP
jgi:hypothetical protein